MRGMKARICRVLSSFHINFIVPPKSIYKRTIRIIEMREELAAAELIFLADFTSELL